MNGVDRLAAHLGPAHDFNGHQNDVRLGKLNDLQRFRVGNQLNNIIRDRLFRPYNGSRTKPRSRQKRRIFTKLIIAHTRDARRNIKKLLGNQSYGEICFVVSGHGNNHVRVHRSGLGKNRGRRRVAYDALKVVIILNVCYAVLVCINNRNVVGLRH